MALHVLSKHHFSPRSKHYWESFPDFVATMEGFALFGLALLALSFIAPLVVLAIPFFALAIAFNWYCERREP